MMRSTLQKIGVHAVMAALVLLSPCAVAKTFNYLYIEASEGNSSGGHVAIQFDDDIYHYQHVDSGLIRLFRQQQGDFHFLYRYLQNRPMHLSRIEVSEDTFDLLKDQFKWQFLTQENRFKLLDALHRDRIFIRHLLHRLTAEPAWFDDEARSLLRLQGVGLFYPEPGHQSRHPDSELARQQSLGIQRLRQKVEQRHGPGFLPRKRAQITAQIEALTPRHWPSLDANPAAFYSFTESASDSLTALFALKVLSEAPPLQADAILLTQQHAFRIVPAERPRLQALRDEMETGLIKAIASSRPDWGYAVLVNLARYLAVEASLQSGFWAFVDDFTEHSESVRPAQYLEHQAQLRILIRDAGAAWQKNRQVAASRERLTEAEYSQIERSANRYFELLKGEQHRDFRFNGQHALPSKSIGFPAGPLPNLTKAQLTAALSEVDHAEHSLFETLRQSHRYDLITHNCATELFRTLDQALTAPYRSRVTPADLHSFTVKASKKRLGGYVETAYNFIPFVSYQAVLKQYRVRESLDLASYRGLELARLKARHNSLITAARESNVLSSRLYQYNPDDALFVFFTDDLVLLRPLFGLVNTAAGIGQSVYGLLSWPFDSGKNLQSGATGILMSLPELFFFNMRKGSYKYLSFTQMSVPDWPGE